MSNDFKLSDQDRDAVLKDFKAFAEQGGLDPAPVFAPRGFDFDVRYFRGTQKALPIPEFRAYAHQFLSVLAIVLYSKPKLFGDTLPVLTCMLEASNQDLNFRLVATPHLHSSNDSDDGRAPEQEIATTLSKALPALFPTLQPRSCDCEPKTGHAIFWIKYPGYMTASGLQKVLLQPNISFADRAQLETSYPTEEQHKRASAVLDLLIFDSGYES